MKEKINILRFCDINRFLPYEKMNYITIEEGLFFYIKDLPSVFNEYGSFLKEYLAYDYDKLSDEHKEIYKLKYISLDHVEKNKYEKTIKIYTLKKHK